MPKIVIQKSATHNTTEATLIWVMGMTVSPLDTVYGVHWASTYAMPGKFSSLGIRILQKGVRQMKDSSTKIDDPRLTQLITEVSPILLGFIDTNQAIQAWQESKVPERLRTAHNKLTRINGPQKPPWHQDSEFTGMLQDLSGTFSLYLDTLWRRIPVLLEMVPPDASPTLSAQLNGVLKKIPDYKKYLTQHP